MVSIIIPCYNAEHFIEKTIQSVLEQSYQDFEIIILNDGSNDNSEAKILSFSDCRISYIKKENTGVSDSRNKGLALAQGTFVLFLDADDVLSRTFLELRLEQLKENPDVLFSCGQVIKINEKGHHIQGFFRGTTDTIYQDILLYNPQIITCPSNYLIRKDILDKYHLTFNTSLSSTADRFFLVELAQYGKGAYVEEGGELFYRVSETSMSHRITTSLVKDNELFYKALAKKKGTISDVLMEAFSFKIKYILGAAYLRVGNYYKGIFYLLSSFKAKPVLFLNNIFKKK